MKPSHPQPSRSTSNAHSANVVLQHWMSMLRAVGSPDLLTLQFSDFFFPLINSGMKGVNVDNCQQGAELSGEI